MIGRLISNAFMWLVIVAVYPMVAFKNGIHRKEEDNMWKYDKERDQVIECTELTGRVVAGHRQLNAFREALGLEKRDKEFKDDEKQDYGMPESCRNESNRIE